MRRLLAIFGFLGLARRGACRKMHGKQGTYERLPKSMEELDESYSALMRELAKR